MHLTFPSEPHRIFTKETVSKSKNCCSFYRKRIYAIVYLEIFANFNVGIFLKILNLKRFLSSLCHITVRFLAYHCAKLEADIPSSLFVKVLQNFCILENPSWYRHLNLIRICLVPTLKDYGRRQHAPIPLT